MKAMRGHFGEAVVALDETAPVSYVTEVTVEIPKADAPPPHNFHWQQRLPTDTFEGSVADEVIRQRRIEDAPE